MHVVVATQHYHDLVVLVAEADALYIGAVVVPHLAEFQLHTHLLRIQLHVNTLFLVNGDFMSETVAVDVAGDSGLHADLHPDLLMIMITAHSLANCMVHSTLWR